MATTLAFRFPWGRYHATPWGRHVNEGAVEWPPSPRRILRALYATWRDRLPELPEVVVQRVLGALCDPPIFRLPPEVAEAHTRHWVPAAGFPREGRAMAFDTCKVFDSRAELLVTWPVDLDDADRGTLAALAERLPYLGRAESLCEAWLLEGEPPAGAVLTAPLGAGAVTGNAALTSVLVPERPLDVAALTTRTMTVRGSKRVDPPGSYRQPYVIPEQAAPAPARRQRSEHDGGDRPDAVRWAVNAAARPGEHQAVGLADLLRRACMAMYGRQNRPATGNGAAGDEGAQATARGGQPRGPASPVLAGKDEDGTVWQRQHRHAHYLALDVDGDRLLDTLVLWAPDGLGAKELAAASAVTDLVDPSGDRELHPVRVGLEAVGPVDRIARELVGPSARWRSATPFAAPRHKHRRQTTDEFIDAEVRRELEDRGKPAPVLVRVVPGGWLRYRRRRAGQPLEESLPAFGIEVEFGELVEGPLALGKLSHFSLGLLLPARQ